MVAGETPFEICVGAILVQNTSGRMWAGDCELESAEVLSPRHCSRLPERKLAE